MDLMKIIRGLFQRKIVVLLVAIVILFVVLFNSGMFGGKDTRVRITCAGDSITYGSGVIDTREMDSYPAQLAAKLGTSHLVSNYGLRFATASFKGDLPYVESKEYKESLKSNPDIVVLMLGTNDAKDINWDSQEYKKDLTTLVETYQKLPSEPRVFLMRSPYCFPVDGSDEVAYGIDGDVVSGELGDIIYSVADETGADFIDLYKVTEGKEKLYTDGIHFTADGYELIANTVYKAIKEAK